MGIKPGDIHFGKLSDFICEHFKVSHKKSIYYNSLPDIADGKEKYYKHIKFLSGIGKLPKFEVKTKKLQKSSNKEIQKEKIENLNSLDLCPSCKPLIEGNCIDCVGNVKKREKGIDIMIAIDMLHLSVIKNNCDCCILVSGDADFIPAMDIIKKKGKKVFSSSLKIGYSYELREEHPYFILNQTTLRENCLK